MSPDTVRVRQL